MPTIDWRCARCRMLLGRFVVMPHGTIKCRKCGYLNALAPETPSAPSATISKEAPDAHADQGD